MAEGALLCMKYFRYIFMHCLILVHFCVTFDNDDIGQKALEEHKVWIELNSVQQLSIYRSLVRSHWPQINEDIREGSNEESAVVQTRNGHMKLDGDENTNLAVLKGFDTNVAFQLLEQEIKDVVCSILGDYYVLIFSIEL